MVYVSRVSLVAEVGNYEHMDQELARRLKSISKTASFLKVVKEIGDWAKEDIENHKKAEYSARSSRLTI
jgi:uncharacterized protein with von Willebrand factor type A (vWA) domain